MDPYFTVKMDKKIVENKRLMHNLVYHKKNCQTNIKQTFVITPTIDLICQNSSESYFSPPW